MDADPVTRTQADLPLRWDAPAGERVPRGLVRYRGALADSDRPLNLHLGFDGDGPPFLVVPLDRDDDGSWTGEVPDSEGHLLLDGAVAGEDSNWDNNGGANYRLWIGLDPVDAHVHARSRGLEPMGFDSLRIAVASGGMTHALVSWQDNRFVDDVTAGAKWLTKLVWVSPGGPPPDEVRRRLADGAVGLKLHPSYDQYPADTRLVDPFLSVAAEAGVPVTVHTAPGPSDPDLIRRLADRFPDVPFVLYHTFLGLPEGRRRAARHAQESPNLYLETSWCRSAEVRLLLDEVGVDRVIFGSDAATDGPMHFVRSPPNIEMVENYNQSLLALARRLPPATLRALLEDNTRRLFRLSAPVAALPEPAEALEQLFADALAQAERVVAAVPRNRLSSSTPCPDWDVRALLGHLLSVVRRAEQAAQGRPTSVPDVLGVRQRATARFAAAAAKAGKAWTTRPPDAVAAPWGLLPGPVALSGFLLEVVAHTHDLAVSTGQRQPLDPRLAEAAQRAAARLVPPALRGGGAAFADPVPSAPGADAYVRLAAYLGRVPR